MPTHFIKKEIIMASYIINDKNFDCYEVIHGEFFDCMNEVLSNA